MAWKPFQIQICIDLEHSSIQLEELWQKQQAKAAQIGGMKKLGVGTEPMCVCGGDNKHSHLLFLPPPPICYVDELEAGSGQSWSLNQSRQPSFGL